MAFYVQVTTSGIGDGEVTFPPLKLDASTYPDPRYYYHNYTGASPLEARISQAYGQVVGAAAGHSVPGANYSAVILDEAKRDTFSYRQNMVAGLDYGEKNEGNQDTVTVAKAMYNAVPLHALPISVNLMNNAILKHFAR